MALRSPVSFHNFWGASFTDDNNLPNNPGNPLAILHLEAGDFAYVAEGASKTFWVCTDPGVVSGGNATWVQLTTGAPTTDRFAPKYIVGNTSAGDDAAQYLGAGFNYYADTGNGAQLEQALLAAAVAGDEGDIWIRPGTYNLTGVLTLPLVIPANTRVIGSGATTVIAHTISTGIGTVFQLNEESSLKDIVLQITDDGTATGAGLIEANQALVTSYCEMVRVELNRDALSSSTIYAAFFAIEDAILKCKDCSVAITGVFNGTTHLNAITGWRGFGALRLDGCSHTGGQAGVVEILQDLEINQTHINDVELCGVWAYGCNCAVSGNTKITSIQNTTTGIKYEANALTKNLTVVGIRIELPTGVSNYGILSDAAVGQVVANRITASTGVDTSVGAGNGHTIGLNVIEATVAQHVVDNGTTDEVAHNILF